MGFPSVCLVLICEWLWSITGLSTSAYNSVFTEAWRSRVNMNAHGYPGTLKSCYNLLWVTVWPVSELHVFEPYLQLSTFASWIHPGDTLNTLHTWHTIEVLAFFQEPDYGSDGASSWPVADQGPCCVTEWARDSIQSLQLAFQHLAFSLPSLQPLYLHNLSWKVGGNELPHHCCLEPLETLAN